MSKQLSSSIRLWTVGTLAKQLKTSITQVEYIVKSRAIGHVLVLGNSRAFDHVGADRVKEAMQDIRRKKTTTSSNP